MGIYSSPPGPRAFYEDKPTLLVSWWCTIFAAVIIVFRICGRMVRNEELFKEDKVALAALIPLFARMACVHVVLLWGTNNTTLEGLSDRDIWRREIGSRLVLLSRILYPATLWILKYTITEFFKRLILQIWRRSYEVTLQCIRWFLLITFIAVIIADLAECTPIQHYWQVRPDPGPQCRQGYAWLLTLGVSNVITDILLIVFPIPIILQSIMPIGRKVQLIFLFSTSVAPVAVMLYQIPMIIEHHSLQQRRTLWASVEILFATAVANGLTLGSFVRGRGVKKVRWRYGSGAADSIEREASRRGTMVQQWGSDEDLVRDMGISVNPEIRGAILSGTPRTAPMAVRANAPITSPSLIPNWQFPASSNVESDDSELVKEPQASHSPGEATVVSPYKVSFFDVGGLLSDNSPGSYSLGTQNSQGSGSGTAALDFAMTGGSERKGSNVLLQDIGAIMPSTRPTQRETPQLPVPTLLRQSSEPVRSPPTRRPTGTTLYDVGGLLSTP